jgi:hypothetical protein
MRQLGLTPLLLLQEPAEPLLPLPCCQTGNASCIRRQPASATATPQTPRLARLKCSCSRCRRRCRRSDAPRSRRARGSCRLRVLALLLVICCSRLAVQLPGHLVHSRERRHCLLLLARVAGCCSWCRTVTCAVRLACIRCSLLLLATSASVNGSSSCRPCSLRLLASCTALAAGVGPAAVAAAPALCCFCRRCQVVAQLVVLLHEVLLQARNVKLPLQYEWQQ